MTHEDAGLPLGFSVDTGPLAARQVLERIFAALAPWSLDIEEKGTIELLLAEVVNNIVEHAYPEPDTGGRIDVACRLEPNGLCFEICDHGRAMPNGQAPFGAQMDVDVGIEDLPEGGFGWFLIRDLARDVAYERVGQMNRLTLRLAITRPK